MYSILKNLFYENPQSQVLNESLSADSLYRLIYDVDDLEFGRFLLERYAIANVDDNDDYTMIQGSLDTWRDLPIDEHEKDAQISEWLYIVCEHGHIKHIGNELYQSKYVDLFERVIRNGWFKAEDIVCTNRVVLPQIVTYIRNEHCVSETIIEAFLEYSKNKISMDGFHLLHEIVSAPCMNRHGGDLNSNLAQVFIRVCRHATLPELNERRIYEMARFSILEYILYKLPTSFPENSILDMIRVLVGERGVDPPIFMNRKRQMKCERAYLVRVGKFERYVVRITMGRLVVGISRSDENKIPIELCRRILEYRGSDVWEQDRIFI